jgi:hypothetical protein
MNKKWTMADLKSKGIHVNSNGVGKKIDKPTPKKVSKKKVDAVLKKLQDKAVDKLEIDPKDFIEFALKNSIFYWVKEYKFDEERKFRFDWAIPALKFYFEYDGLQSEKSGHSTLVGFTSDTEKRSLATDLGWRGKHYTILNYKNIIKDLEKLKQ